MTTIDIIKESNQHHCNDVIGDVLRKYIKSDKSTVFKLQMYICKYFTPSLFTKIIPTMFTTHGRFYESVVPTDESEELHEIDIQTCIPPCGQIMRIKSNWGDTIQNGYTPRIKRKSKKPKKKKRGIQGNGSSFNSQATVTVLLPNNVELGLPPNKVYSVKIFRKLKYVIPHCVLLDNRDAKYALGIVINAMNIAFPNRGYYVDFSNMETPMHNFKFQLKSLPERCIEKCGIARCRNLCDSLRIDLHVLTDILKVIWESENMCNPPDKEDTGNYAGLLVRFDSGYNDGKKVTVCIQKSGKVTINGTVAVSHYMAIYYWCNWIIHRYSKWILYEIKEFVPLSDDD